MKRLTQEEFVEKAKIVHNNKYNTYGKYIDNKTKISIFCDEHGIFFQTPKDHLQNKGCAICGDKRISNKLKSNTFDFIKKANIIHDFIYTYESTIYVNNQSNVDITCPKHGIFSQLPSNHLSGHGCKHCGTLNKINKLRSNIIEFAEKANDIHDFKYSYFFGEYINGKTKIDIFCPIKDHGLFLQTPEDHLSGKGCNKCGIIKRSNKLRSNLIDFIKKANIVHNFKYLYIFGIYKHSKIKMDMFCPIEDHGIFSQLPTDHLSGKGCPRCINKNQSETHRCLINLLPNVNIQSEYKISNNKNYYIDFYFEYNNKIYIVEYNGIQHYQPTKWNKSITDSQAEINFINQQIRDTYIYYYCTEKEYQFIEIDCRKISFDQIYNYLNNILYPTHIKL